MTLFHLLLIWGMAAAGFVLVLEGVAGMLPASQKRRAEGPQPDGDLLKVPDTSGVETASRWNPGRIVQAQLNRADFNLSVSQFYWFIAMSSTALFIVSFLLAGYLPFWARLAGSVAIGCVLPFAYLRTRIRKRAEKFQEQFPDALDLICRSLRIGHPLSAALTTIGAEIPDPVGQEFRIAARQVSYGMSPPEAIEGIARRVGLPDARFFAVAIQIHYEAGGNLAEILEGLAAVIRSRFHLFRKVSALTAEGRFSAWFLSLFPIAMIFLLNLTRPGYYAEAHEHPFLVAIVFSMLLANAVVARSITQLKI